MSLDLKRSLAITRDGAAAVFAADADDCEDWDFWDTTAGVEALEECGAFAFACWTFGGGNSATASA